MKKSDALPWAHLDEFRGRVFNTEWPTFPEMFRINQERFPNNPCFTDFDGDKGSKRTFTYTEILKKINRLSSWLIEQGVKKDDKVAVIGKNSPEWATVYIATLFASAVIVPLDNGLHETEVCNLLNTAKPKIIFCEEEREPEVANITDLQVFSLSPKKEERYVFNLQPKTEVAPNQPCSPEDVAAILFTSGTTGTPKGVMLTHKNLISDCYIAQINFNHYNDVFYALLPIHHAYTMQAAFINPLSQGGEVVFGKSMAVSRLMRELRDGKITVMLGVPLLYNKLLAGIKKGIRDKGIFVAAIMKMLMGLSYAIKKLTGKNPGRVFFKSVLKQANLSTLRMAISGGGPLSPDVFKAYNAAGINFIQGYGLTETSPIIALNPVEKFKIESVGQTYAPHEEVKIIDADKNGIGEIVVKGPMVMKGYYNMPEETAKMFTEDGFFKTGDLGRLDNENYIYLCGRAKNLIVTSGGKNVYPEEIENAFQMYDNINQITVQGYEEADGEEIEALIYPSDDVFKKLGVKREEMFASDDVREIIQKDVDSVNHKLQPYSRIKRITILEKPLEMTTSLKVKRTYKK